MYLLTFLLLVLKRLEENLNFSSGKDNYLPISLCEYF